jgi:hypothetical protein
MKRTLTESGEWRDGGASPTLLPDNLRKLPGELVTNDADDESKAHELDAPHVVNTIVGDFAKLHGAEQKDDTPAKVAKKLWAPGPGERAPVRQWFVDVVKLRVLSVLVNQAVDDCNAGIEPDLRVRHLWFETDNVNAYELRRGNPPSNKYRPRHMRNIDLVVDVMLPPRSIVELLAAKGIELDVKKLMREAEEAKRNVLLI